jgi:hypothetical protein
MVLCGMASGWGAMYFAGWIFGSAPAGNITHGLVWLLLGFMWWAISGLTNPEKTLEGVKDGVG